jgi:17beta-estradiol 17-dehydrogenase / very-long-chain 3-oxoacyl-CoA reductase
MFKLLRPRNILLTLGLYKLGCLAKTPLQGSYHYYFVEQEDLVAKYGEYALVTGGSDGLGKIFVEKLQKMGFKVIIVSRSEEKMKEI